MSGSNSKISRDYPLTIYYDGGCRVCHAEMGHYRRLNPDGRFQFVDFSHADFMPDDSTSEPEALRRALHVRDAA